MFKVNMHTIKITLIFIIVCLIPQNINYNHIYHLTLLIQDNKNLNMLAFNLTYKHALHQHKKQDKTKKHTINIQIKIYTHVPF